MGLLDFSSTPEGMQGLALLAAAGPSMQPMNLASRMALAGDTYRGLLGDQLKQQFTKAQIDEMQQQQTLRSLQAQALERNNGIISGVLGRFTGQPGTSPGPSQPAIPASPGGALGSGTFGVPMGGQPAAVSAPHGSMLGNLSPDDVAALKLAGVDLADIYKYAHEPQKMDAGGVYTDRLTGKVTTIPSVSQDGKASQLIPDPTAPGGFRVIAPQNSVETYAGYKQAEKRVENDNTLLPLGYVAQGTGRPIGGTVGSYLAGQQGGMPAASAPSAPSTAGAIPAGNGAFITPELRDRIAADAAKNGITNPTLDFKPPAGYSSATFGAMPESVVRAPATGLQGAADAAFTKGRAENMVKYEDGLNGRVQEGANLNMRLQESIKALDAFRAGGGAEVRAKLAQVAQAVGAPQNVVNGIAGGDLASMQEFNKLAVQQAMEQLKQSMGGAGRIAQAEFKVFQANNPNLDTDPTAIRKIFDFNTRVFNRDLSEQNAFNEHINSGGDPTAFPQLWSRKQTDLGFTNPSLSAQPKAAASKLPVPMKGMVRNGYRFTGGDPSSPSSWEKQ